MGVSESDFLPGTLDLLILKTLAMGESHGWGVSRRIRNLSRDILDVNQGSLYPALHRLEQRGLIESHWGTPPDNNRRVKLYRLTDDGAKALARERASWEGFVQAVARILDTV